MAKVVIKGLVNVQKRVREAFDTIRKDESLLIDIGNVTVSDIVNNARAGRNPEDKKSFPTLSSSWIDRRNYLKRFNTTAKLFLDSSKSNLTFTGKLLESISFKLNRSSASVEVYAKGTHPGYKTKSGRTKSVSNENLVEYLSDKGFVFVKVSKQLRTRINVLTKRFIRQLIIKNKI